MPTANFALCPLCHKGVGVEGEEIDFTVAEWHFKKMGLIFFAGFFGNLFPAFCFAIAILKIDSSLAGIINSLTPICVVTIGIFFFKDRIKTQKILGVLVGFGGLCLLTLTQQNIRLDNLGYALLIVAGTLSYGINVNLVGHHLKETNPIMHEHYLAIVSNLRTQKGAEIREALTRMLQSKPNER